MITLKVQGVAALQKNVNKVLKRKIPRAVVNGLNRTGYTVKNDMTRSLGKYIDRPNKFTQRFLRVDRAKMSRKVVYITSQPIQERYLKFQVFGGSSSRPKVVPFSSWPKNQYGNLARGTTKRANAFRTTLKGKIVYFMKQGRKGDRRAAGIGHIPTMRSYRKRYPFFKLGRAAARGVYVQKIRSEIRKAAATL